MSETIGDRAAVKCPNCGADWDGLSVCERCMALAKGLKLHLIRKRGKYQLFGCRQRLPGCKVTEAAREKMGPCSDCVLGDPNETVEQFAARILRVN